MQKCRCHQCDNYYDKDTIHSCNMRKCRCEESHHKDIVHICLKRDCYCCGKMVRKDQTHVCTKRKCRTCRRHFESVDFDKHVCDRHYCNTCCKTCPENVDHVCEFRRCSGCGKRYCAKSGMIICQNALDSTRKHVEYALIISAAKRRSARILVMREAQT
jgi:hypothetical protein